MTTTGPPGHPPYQPLPQQREFLPLRSRAWWAIRILALIAIVDVAAVGSDWLEYDLLGRVAAGEVVSDAALDANDFRQGAFGVVQLVSYVLGAVFFLRWFHRAYGNLDHLGAGRRYRKGWAIAGWFVPILNLFRPKQIANDIWHGSDPDRPDARPALGRPGPLLLGAWWAAFLVSSWLDQVAGRLAFSGDTVEEVRRSAVAFMISDATGFVAALLAILVVRRTTHRQEERAARRRAAADTGEQGAAA